MNEVRILASLESPYIIKYKEAFIVDQPSSLCIVMEYADGGDLYDAINEHKKNQTHFSEEEIWNVLVQVVLAF